MKSEVRIEHIAQFRNKLLTSLIQNKKELERIETVLWKEHNRFALWWNSKFHKVLEMPIYNKEVVSRNSLRYGLQRAELEHLIGKQSTLLERLDYAIENGASVVFEDSDYNLLK